MNIRRILAAGAVAIASLGAVAGTSAAASAMPIPAFTHTQFVVVDGNGVLYTSEPLTAGQVIHHGTTWFTVRSVRPYGTGGVYEIITVTPQAPAGARVAFWT